ncbi:MAG: ATP-binding protein [Sulfolobales archaeon]|nr:ATP-binding protein [Sulfolobales archaeon]MDW8082521.1 ATP-binding protein [Sulfolobales archaeon]
MKEAADVRLLWSNLYKVRTIFTSRYDVVENHRSYRLLSILAKYASDLYELMLDPQERNSGLILKIDYNRRLSPGALAHANLLMSMNIASELVDSVSQTGVSPAVLLAIFKSLNPEDIVSCSLTFSRSITPSTRIKPLAVVVSGSYLRDTRRSISSLGILIREAQRTLEESVGIYKRDYLDLVRNIGLLGYKPIALVVVQNKVISVEEIRAVVSDGNEYREVKIPIRSPEWSLEDLPPKVVEELKLVVINPFRSGLPFATKGTFITGPPGVGKSVMAEAIANALGLRVVELKPFTYRSMWYGATEKMLNAILNQVYKKRREVALVIDDAEFLSSRKYTIHEAHLSELSTILYHLQRADRPFTILTGNNPDLLDPALLRPGRVDVTVVVGYPDRDMRRKATLRNVSKYRIKTLSEKVVDYIVSNTQWYSLAELDALVRLAASKGSGVVGIEEVEWARRRILVSPSERRNIQDYLKWWSTKIQGITITYIPSEHEID